MSDELEASETIDGRSPTAPSGAIGRLVDKVATRLACPLRHHGGNGNLPVAAT